MQRKSLLSGFIFWFVVVIMTCLSRSASAQIGMGGSPRPVLFRGATIYTMEGDPIENGELLVVGKRIKAVGKNLEVPPRTRTIDCEGKVIVPCFIDAASVMGLPSRQGKHSSEHNLLDAVSLDDRELIRATLSAGVGYAYLRDASGPAPVGARGLAVQFTQRPRMTNDQLSVSGTEALHVKLGRSTSGPASRNAEVSAFEKLLKGARKYEEAWDKYTEDLEKYEKELAEWAKKNKGKKPSDLKSTAKPSAKPTARPTTGRTGPTRRRFPRPRPPSVPTIDEWADTSVRCPVCGGDEDDGHQDHIPGMGIPFQFDEFRPDELAFEDKKPDAKSKSTETASKGPAKPKEPSYKRSTAQLVRALNGEMKVRIEVHHAEVILALLDVLKTYPMEVVFEGCTEGYVVADQLAKAGYPIVLRSQPVKPLAEKARSASGGSSSRFRFPRGMRIPPNFRIGPTSVSSAPALLTSEENAATLADAGARVVIGSLGESASGTRLLRDRAAYAAGWGLGKQRALASITINAAHALGIADSLGSLKAKKTASFLVLDGDVFDSATTVENVYMTGRRAYRK